MIKLSNHPNKKQIMEKLTNLRKRFLKITLLIFILTVSINSFSQIKFGVAGGYCVNNLVTTQPHSGINEGFTVGGFVAYKLSDQLQIHAGVDYLQIGGRQVSFVDDTRYGKSWNEPFAVYSKDSKVTIHTVNVPIQAKFNIIGSKDVTLYVSGAVEFGFNVFAKSIA